MTDPDTFFNRFLQVKSVSEGHALIADNTIQITRLFIQRIIQRVHTQREENPVKAREMLDMLAYATMLHQQSLDLYTVLGDPREQANEICNVAIFALNICKIKSYFS